ncbi:phospholipase A2 [Candidatus Thiomargarita nelsonii]|uniref:Phospholipase A2 n=1 Tax=Candidatus Thiomargarita nelsonii TaxID=1003181 RepID=A0A176RT49_9GAMM|nr:phospholipase A2 [Candidatus Thiomargarita nelsonii]
MNWLHNRLVQLNRDRNKGMKKQKSLLREAAGTVKQGFSVLQADLEASQLQATEMKQEKLALANRQLFSAQQIAKKLEKKHQQRATQTKQLRKTLDSIVEAQQWTRKAVKHQTEVMIYNTDKLLAAEQETRKLMSQFLRQFIDEIKQGKGCGDENTNEVVPDEWGDADFYPACQKHDKCYETCGKLKKFCDDSFHDDLKKECRSLDIGEMPCLELTKMYYWGVSKGGDKSWKKAQKDCLPQ